MKALRRKSDKAWIDPLNRCEVNHPFLTNDSEWVADGELLIHDDNGGYRKGLYELVDVEVTVKEPEPPKTHAIKDIVIEARYDNGRWIGEVCVKYDDCREMHKLASMDEFRPEILTKELIASISRELTGILNQEPDNAGIGQIVK